jgi:hypothetical protein
VKSADRFNPLKLASGFLCGRHLTISHLVIDQRRPAVVAHVHAGKFERRR